MQIVIDIDDDMYEYIKGLNNGFTDYRTTLALYDAVRNGISLPKGHGRLIDADKIGLTNFEIFMCGGNYKDALKMILEKINNAPTIIEADKEVKGNADSDLY